jgi:DNA-binding response OmpR family regulator
MKVIIVEDDARTAAFVEKAFRADGFVTRRAEDGEKALWLATNEGFDIAVIDVMLPKLDGLSLLRELRARGAMFPAIILSALGSVENKVSGLAAGGDDYLSKPFSVTELLARAHALLRRASRETEAPIIAVEDLTLDTQARRATRAGRRIDLQPLEFQLLEYLLRNRGRVVSKTTIMEHVWQYDFDTGTNLVESRVCHLREKIDKPFEKPLIKTVRGFGYVIE